MVSPRLSLAAGLFGLLAFVPPAAAAERDRCLSPDERRAKIATHAVVPLAKAIRALKVRRAEVVRANLCERGGKLVYLLTVLPRDGKVSRAAIDATTGAVVGR
jgi:uncharacterized membrane protein YkoI